ncbi:MAG: polysaccharide deacetylase family protein [Patescibacteria group bacterium]
MNAKLSIALVLLFAVLLTGCQGTVPAVTSEPTAVVPTEVPPTAVPSPTPTEVPTEIPATTPPSDLTVVIPNPAEIMAYVSEEAVLAECLDVYPTGMGMFEVGAWTSKYWDYLVLKGTGEEATPENSPVQFSLPLGLENQPRCVAALYLDQAGNAYLLYEVAGGEVRKISLVPASGQEPTPTMTPDDRIRVALTVDDGWSGASFDTMLDLLARHDTRTTFFLVTKAVYGLGPERMERLVADGHEIAYHSYGHDDLAVLQTWGTSDWLADYDRWDREMRAFLGEENSRAIVPYARAPYGLFSPGFMRMAEEREQLTFSWSATPGSLNRGIPLNEGDIFLFHVRQSDLGLFEDLLSRTEEFRFLSIGEYLQAGLP